MTKDEFMNTAPDKTELLKMINRITTAIGTSDPKTAFIACGVIMQNCADLMGIEFKGLK
jgi:hypothetical protein